MKTRARDSPDYNTYKTNISTYNRILKKEYKNREMSLLLFLF